MNEIALGWKFSANSQNDKIISFSFGVISFPLPAMIIADNDEQANAIRDRMHDVFFYDVVKNVKGRLIYRNFTLYCNINESTHSGYQEWTAFGDVALTVTTDDPYWRKAQDVILASSNSDVGMKNAADYPYDYPFDYGIVQNKLYFENNSFIESNFIMQIQGEVTTPIVYINEHLYSVDVTLSECDILNIDSRESTIKLIKANGEIENCFDLRNRDSYIFQKIPAGKNTIKTNQKLRIMLTYFDERGEPRWS